jgi:hypothetical protein
MVVVVVVVVDVVGAVVDINLSSPSSSSGCLPHLCLVQVS